MVLCEFMAKNIEINYNNGTQYEVLYPKVLLNNVSDWNDSIYSKTEVDSLIEENKYDWEFYGSFDKSYTATYNTTYNFWSITSGDIVLVPDPDFLGNDFLWGVKDFVTSSYSSGFGEIDCYGWFGLQKAFDFLPVSEYSGYMSYGIVHWGLFTVRYPASNAVLGTFGAPNRFVTLNTHYGSFRMDFGFTSDTITSAYSITFSFTVEFYKRESEIKKVYGVL